MEQQSPLQSKPTHHDPQLDPSLAQKQFFDQYILGEESTILTLKLVNHEQRGFALNMRGPFILQCYNFPDGRSETVIDAAWAGRQESNSHLHCCWTEVRFAKLSRANPAILRNLGYHWQLAFFATKDDATNDHHRLFWFYLENDNHKAVRGLINKVGHPIPIV